MRLVAAWRSLQEAAASELAARMTAMKLVVGAIRESPLQGFVS